MNNKNSLSHRNPEPERNVLYIVGTPIGNLADISNRALHILKNVSFIACEDTRQTKKLMNKYDIKNRLISFNKNNSFKKISDIISSLKQDKSVAVVSDAGMPSICDPGEDLVKEARLNDIDIICVPGSCAALTALVSSGMPASRFNFEGFLPRKKKEREKILMEINESDKTTILYESPLRLKNLLQEIKKFCGGTREVQVSRELTKKFEENVFDNVDNLINFFKKKEILGEITLVIMGVHKRKNINFEPHKLREELSDLINAGLSLSAAAKYLAKKKNLQKSMIYNLY